MLQGSVGKVLEYFIPRLGYVVNNIHGDCFRPLDLGLVYSFLNVLVNPPLN